MAEGTEGAFLAREDSHGRIHSRIGLKVPPYRTSHKTFEVNFFPLTLEYTPECRLRVEVEDERGTTGLSNRRGFETDRLLHRYDPLLREAWARGKTPPERRGIPALPPRGRRKA